MLSPRVRAPVTGDVGLHNRMIAARSLVAACCIAAPSWGTAADPCGANLGVWLECNNPRVINYLNGLGPGDVGTNVKGVALSDGSMELAGITYLGPAKQTPYGVHLFIFERDKHKIAYLWVEKGAKEFELPSCPKSVSFESAYVLSGDVYTWKAAQPGDGVIRVACIAPKWAAK